MGRVIGPVCRRCRRENQKLYLKGTRCYTEKCSMEATRKNYPPGQHGTTAVIKLSDYGIRFRELQKLKAIYGILERQCKRYFEISKKAKGSTGETFLILLERRLDNVLYRAGFTLTRKQARQMISHGHVIVGKRKVDRPSYLVKIGDVIQFKDGIKSLVKNAISLRRNSVPAWLEVNDEEMKIHINRFPERQELDVPINERLIVEYYSK
jgi:small subunit ribosomal protein S4